jgi:hypothetical protein
MSDSRNLDVPTLGASNCPTLVSCFHLPFLLRHPFVTHFIHPCGRPIFFSTPQTLSSPKNMAATMSCVHVLCFQSIVAVMTSTKQHQPSLYGQLFTCFLNLSGNHKTSSAPEFEILWSQELPQQLPEQQSACPPTFHSTSTTLSLISTTLLATVAKTYANNLWFSISPHCIFEI